MSVDEAAVRKVFEQLKGQHNEAGRQLGAVRQQTAVRERELKGTVLTLREIEALPRGTDGVTCYKGVGRMFMQESRNAIENTLKAKDKELNEELSALGKKAKYLENEMKLSEGSFRDLMQETRR